jgi:hypothetical protein
LFVFFGDVFLTGKSWSRDPGPRTFLPHLNFMTRMDHMLFREGKQNPWGIVSVSSSASPKRHVPLPNASVWVDPTHVLVLSAHSSAPSARNISPPDGWFTGGLGAGVFLDRRSVSDGYFI